MKNCSKCGEQNDNSKVRCQKCLWYLNEKYINKKKTLLKTSIVIALMLEGENIHRGGLSYGPDSELLTFFSLVLDLIFFFLITYVPLKIGSILIRKIFKRP